MDGGRAASPGDGGGAGRSNGAPRTTVREMMQGLVAASLMLASTLAQQQRSCAEIRDCLGLVLGPGLERSFELREDRAERRSGLVLEAL